MRPWYYRLKLQQGIDLSGMLHPSSWLEKMFLCSQHDLTLFDVQLRLTVYAQCVLCAHCLKSSMCSQPGWLR